MKMFKNFLSLLFIVLFSSNVYADMIQPNDIYFNNTEFNSYYEIPVIYSSNDLRIEIIDKLSRVPSKTNLILDICSTDKFNIWRTSAAGSSCSTSCFSQLIQVKKIPNMVCRTYSYNDRSVYRVIIPISLWDMSAVTSSTFELISLDDKITISNPTSHDIYASIYGAYYSDFSFDLNNEDALFSELNQTQQNILNKQNELNQNIKDTNSKLDEAENTRKGILETIKSLPKTIVDFIIDGLKNLFIPTEEQISSIITSSKSLSYNFGFIGQIVDFSVQLFTSLLDIVQSNGCVEFPKFSLDFSNIDVIGKNIVLWENKNVCLADNEWFGSNSNGIIVVRSLTTLILLIVFLNFCNRAVFKILSKEGAD